MNKTRAAPLILIINDEPCVARHFAEALEREGYTTAEVPNGEEALAWLGSHPMPDVILLDVVMPVMDGFQFLKLRQADPLFVNIPVVLLLPKFSDDELGKADLRNAVDLGVDAWLYIPCVTEDIPRIVTQRFSGQTGTLVGPDAPRFERISDAWYNAWQR